VWGLALVPLLAALALGTVHVPAQAVLGLLAGGLGLLGAWRRSPAGRPARAPLVAGALGAGFAVLAWLALLPAAAGLRAALQPGFGPLVAASLKVAGARAHPLAIDPRGALLGVAFLGLVLAYGAGVATVARSQRAARRIAVGSALAGVAVGAVGLLQRAEGARAIYGFTDFGRGNGIQFFGPFVYQNHAAAFLAICLPLAVGLAAAEGRRMRALPWWIAAAFVGQSVLLTGSRGGVLLAVFGLWAVVVLGVRGAGRWVATGVAALLVLVLAVLGPHAVLADYTAAVQPDYPASHDVDAGRPALWRDAARVIRAAPLLGVGTGGYHDAATVVKRSPTFAQPVHAHSDLLQVPAEQGIPAALLALGALGITLAAGLRAVRALPPGHRRWRAVAGTASVGVLALAACFDFPLRSGAIALLGASTMGALLALATREEPSAPTRWQTDWRVGQGLLVATSALALAGAALARPAGSSVWGATGPLLDRADALLADHPDAEAEAQAVDLYRLALARRPLDGEILVRLAHARYLAGAPDDALALLDRASAVYPTLPSAWLAKARILRAQGDLDGARTAYRQLLSLNLPDLTARPQIEEALSTAKPPRDAVDAAIPERPDRRCEAARVLTDAGDRPAAETLYAAEQGRLDQCAVMWAEDLMRWGDPKRAEALVRPLPEGCGRERVLGFAEEALGHYDEAIDALTTALTICAVKDIRTRRVLARARMENGQVAEGLRVLEGLVRQHPNDDRLRKELVTAYLAHGQTEKAAPQIERLLRDGVLESDPTTGKP